MGPQNGTVCVSTRRQLKNQHERSVFVDKFILAYNWLSDMKPMISHGNSLLPSNKIIYDWSFQIGRVVAARHNFFAADKTINVRSAIKASQQSWDIIFFFYDRSSAMFRSSDTDRRTDGQTPL